MALVRLTKNFLVEGDEESALRLAEEDAASVAALMAAATANALASSASLFSRRAFEEEDDDDDEDADDAFGRTLSRAIVFVLTTISSSSFLAVVVVSLPPFLHRVTEMLGDLPPTSFLLGSLATLFLDVAAWEDFEEEEETLWTVIIVLWSVGDVIA